MKVGHSHLNRQATLDSSEQRFVDPGYVFTWFNFPWKEIELELLTFLDAPAVIRLYKADWWGHDGISRMLGYVSAIRMLMGLTYRDRTRQAIRESQYSWKRQAVSSSGTLEGVGSMELVEGIV
jgi:hypothetical protein